jgi:sec-independent protein translocase protein TatB
MSSGEILVTLVVAVLAFGPKKLPMLARHLALLINQFNKLKNKARTLFDEEMTKQQLSENEQKATKADESYEKHIPLK